MRAEAIILRLCSLPLLRDAAGGAGLPSPASRRLRARKKAPGAK